MLATARATHEINRAYCQSLGDDSQAPWAEAPDWQRASAIKGVEFHLANPDADASASHDSWMAQKVADGWVYGEVKDPDKKTHPCIVPFADLPPEQQLKDVLFKATVHAIYPSFVAAAAELDQHIDNLERAKEAIADLGEKLEAANAKVKAGKAAPGEKKPGKPRKLGPIADAPEDAAERAAELRERMADADQVEILFADGDKDSGLPPAVITGEAWADHANGLKLNVPLDLHGSGHGGSSFRVTGYALLVDGKQVAWAPRLDPVQVGVGQHVRIEDDIFF